MANVTFYLSYENGTNVSNSTAFNTNNYSTTFENLSDAKYNIFAQGFLTNGTLKNTSSRIVHINSTFNNTFNNTVSTAAGYTNVTSILAFVQTNVLAEITIIMESLQLNPSTLTQIIYNSKFGAYKFDNLADGTYNVSSTAVLENGCPYSTGARTIIIDSVVPNATNITNVTQNMTNSQNITVTFNISETPLTVTFRLFNSTGNLTDTQGPTTIQNQSELPLNYSIPSNLSEDIYSLYMTIVDFIGYNVTYFLGNITYSINQSPVLDAIGDKTVTEKSKLEFTVTANDPDGDGLNYTVLNLPSGATFTNQDFEWTPGSTQSGIYNVTFVVTDGFTSDNESILITVKNKKTGGSGGTSSYSPPITPVIVNETNTTNETEVSGTVNNTVNESSANSTITIIAINTHFNKTNYTIFANLTYTPLLFKLSHGVNLMFEINNTNLTIDYYDENVSLVILGKIEKFAKNQTKTFEFWDKFKVKVVEFTEEDVSIEIWKVPKEFYETTWFKIIVGIIIFGAVFASIFKLFS